MNKLPYHDVVHTKEGALLEGRPDIFIPEADLEKIDKIGDEMRAEEAGFSLDNQVERSGNTACKNCGKIFWPRTGSGGKKQKFCCTKCRLDFHATNVPNVAQRGDVESGLPVVVEQPEQKTSPEASDEEVCLLPAQPEVNFYIDENGDIWLTQSNWPDEDSKIVIRRENRDVFIDRLTDFWGIPSAP